MSQNMIDDIRVTVGELKGEDGMKQCHQKAIAVGGSHKLSADSWGHLDLIEERAINGHVSVIHHGSQE